MSGFSYGGRVGYTWDQNQGWMNPTAVKRGTYLAPGVGLAVDYNPLQDTYSAGVNGTTENGMQRAQRWAQDMVNSGQTQNYQNALNFAMAQLSSDWQRGQQGKQPDWRQGTGLGWDANAFRYNDYGEKYNDNINYGVASRRLGPNGQVILTNAAPGQPQTKQVIHNYTDPAGNKVTVYADGSTDKVPPAAATPAVTPPATTPPATNGVPTGYQGTNAGDSGGLSAANRLAMASDPNVAYRYMMQQLGMNPDQVTAFSKFMRQRFQPLLEARIAAGGVQDNSSYMDTVDNLVREFGSGMTQKGGNFFGNLASIGNQAAQSPYLSSLNDQTQVQQYQQQLGQLRFAGANPMVQQAMADQMSNAFNAYNDADFYGNGKVDPFQQWLQQQQRYKGIFGY